MPKPTITSATPLTQRLLVAAAVGIVGLLIVVPLASVSRPQWPSATTRHSTPWARTRQA
jgi:hypothetical protein